MPWDSKYSNFDIVQIDGKNVKVFSDPNNYITIWSGEEVAKAIWAVDELNVTLKSGEVRLYKASITTR